MKSRLLTMLVCPACLPEEIPLNATVHQQDRDDIQEGALRCDRCGGLYPIRDGLAFLDAPSATPRQQGIGYESPKALASYLWSHYGDALGDPEASDAYRQWAALIAPANGPALDIGAAVGRFAFEMQNKCDFVIGIDRSESFIRAARELLTRRSKVLSLPEEGLLNREVTLQLSEAWHSDNIEFIVGDAQALPFRSGIFTCLASLNLVDKLPRPLQHLTEMDRVARCSDAQVLISDPFFLVAGSGQRVPLAGWQNQPTVCRARAGQYYRPAARRSPCLTNSLADREARPCLVENPHSRQSFRADPQLLRQSLPIGKYKEAAMKKITVCRLCSACCSVEADIRDGRLAAVRRKSSMPPERQLLCPKLKAAVDITYSPKRLTTPLISDRRRGQLTFREAGWDEALDVIAERMQHFKHGHGAQSVGWLRGMAADWGAPWDYATRLMHAFGSPNAIGNGSVCHVAREMAHTYTYGAMTIPQARESRCIMVWGKNDQNTCPPAFEAILQARQQGAHLIVIDPICTPLAKIADIWLQIKSGHDGLLAMAMIHTIIEE